jgi:hypothetical protein
VFIMELDDQDDPESMAEDLGISLHALTGLFGANTMHLIVSIGGTNLRALVNSRSMHTFIHDEVVHRLGITITFRPSLSIHVANGERMQSYGTCKSTTLSIQCEDFLLDCYMLPIKGFDVILGVQWLKSLGPIMWDFTALSMAFLRNGRSVQFIGYGGAAPSLHIIQVQDNMLDTLLSTYPDIFANPRGLLPQRRHDHCIHLLPGTTPVVVWP